MTKPDRQRGSATPLAPQAQVFIARIGLIERFMRRAEAALIWFFGDASWGRSKRIDWSRTVLFRHRMTPEQQRQLREDAEEYIARKYGAPL